MSPRRAEVVQPEDAGAGFREVGALGGAKDALREAVQLPLQHPHLFARGTLARPVRGVLLFGPPGACSSHAGPKVALLTEHLPVSQLVASRVPPA